MVAMTMNEAHATGGAQRWMGLLNRVVAAAAVTR